jgi:hypothetical protein
VMIGMEEMKQCRTKENGMWRCNRKDAQKRERPETKEKGTGKGKGGGGEKGEIGKKNRITNTLCSGGNKKKEEKKNGNGRRPGKGEGKTIKNRGEYTICSYLPGFSGLTFSGTRRPGISGHICCFWPGFSGRSFSGMGNLKKLYGVLVSTAGISVLKAGIFWREAKTKRLFSQCIGEVGE